MPPNKKPKTANELGETEASEKAKEISNLLNDATDYTVKLTQDEIDLAEAKLKAYKVGDDMNALWEATKELQRHDHLLPVNEQFAKYPWLKQVIR